MILKTSTTFLQSLQIKKHWKTRLERGEENDWNAWSIANDRIQDEAAATLAGSGSNPSVSDSAHDEPDVLDSDPGPQRLDVGMLSF